MKFNKQSGVAQLVVVAVMAFLVLGLPIATKLVQQNQENRGQAYNFDDVERTFVEKVEPVISDNQQDWVNYTMGDGVCSSDDKKCSTDLSGYYWCENGRWSSDTEICYFGCNKATGDCNKCRTGELICSVNNLKKCVNNVWKSVAKCKYGCDTKNKRCITSNEAKINGDCGATKNSCDSGSFKDLTDSSLSYLWKCMGKNGGISVSCSFKKPVQNHNYTE